MTSPERDLLTGLQAHLTPSSDAPGYVSALPYDIDRGWSISYTNVRTDPLGRWRQGILMLQSRGAPGVPLDADDIAAPLVAELIRTQGLVLGQVSITDCQHGPSSRGLDSSKRSVRADRLDVTLSFL